jgi:hypothetical protein
LRTLAGGNKTQCFPIQKIPKGKLPAKRDNPVGLVTDWKPCEAVIVTKVE